MFENLVVFLIRSQEYFRLKHSFDEEEVVVVVVVVCCVFLLWKENSEEAMKDSLNGQRRCCQRWKKC